MRSARTEHCMGPSHVGMCKLAERYKLKEALRYALPEVREHPGLIKEQGLRQASDLLAPCRLSAEDLRTA